MKTCLIIISAPVLVIAYGLLGALAGMYEGGMEALCRLRTQAE